MTSFCDGLKLFCIGVAICCLVSFAWTGCIAALTGAALAEFIKPLDSE